MFTTSDYQPKKYTVDTCRLYYKEPKDLPANFVAGSVGAITGVTLAGVTTGVVSFGCVALGAAAITSTFALRSFFKKHRSSK